jgi:hypothetical protein
MNNPSNAVVDRGQLYNSKEDRGASFYVKSGAEATPISFLHIATHAQQKAAINISGGCKGMTDDLRQSLFPYFEQALVKNVAGKRKAFAGVVLSGGTSQHNTRSGARVDMVTQIPSYLYSRLPIIAMAHVPKTDVMSLHPDSGAVVMDDYWNGVDKDHHGILVFQPSAGTSGDWDCDVPEYRSWLTGWRDVAGFKVNNTCLNGGDITRDEIYDGILDGLPTIVVKGSGREADAFVLAFQNGDFSATAAELRAKKGDAKADAAVKVAKDKMAGIDRSLVWVADLSDALTLQAGFEHFGLFDGAIELVANA